MAAVENGSPEQFTVIAGSPQCTEVVKEGPLENLMEKLRAKSGHYKQWGEMSKAIRIAIADKRHVIDSVERSQLQKCLDTIQKNIKVTSLQSMVERLDSITRQQGLKFTFGPSNTECYISSDMFYLEIQLEPNGEVKDVKIAHHGEPATCPELTKVLRGGNFTEFTKHLEGLSAIYQLNADKKQKTKAYLALQALEIDLSMLAQLQSSINDPSNLVHKSPVGILQQRQGGFPLKLTYFISPYDLLDVETKSSIPLTVDAVLEKGLGHSVTVCIESSPAHKLQTVSLISISKTPEGKSLPSFAALSNLNSTTLPASFVLKLPEPIPMSTSIVKKIQGVTKITDWIDLSTSQPLLSVIINDTSKGKLQCTQDQGLFVTLPDQHHCYFINACLELQGVLVSAIPFTHPTHVPQILVFLRQQMLFNTIISSCVRPGSKQDVESPLMFEVMAYSTSHIVVSFEHPLEESLATVEMDLKDITNVKCKIYTLSSDATICTDEYASKVMQRCLSIPVTMRAVIRKAQGQRQQMKHSNPGDMYCAAVSGGGNVPYLSHLPNYGNSLTNGSSFSGGDFSNLASRMCSKPSDTSEINSFAKNVGSNPGVETQAFSVSNSSCNSKNNNCNQDIQNMDHSVLSSDLPPHSEMYGVNIDQNISGGGGANSKNPLLGTLLSQSGNSGNQIQFQQTKHANTMLMSMLSDVPSANPSSSSFPFLGQNVNNGAVSSGGGSAKSRKTRKRKATSDNRSPGCTSRSPKRKLSEDECVRDQSTPDMESSDSPMGFDVSSSLPATLPSSTSDQTHLSHAMSSLSAFIKTEPQSHGYPQRSASTDSYLSHENFQAQQLLNVDSHSRLSEGSTPNNPDMFCNVGSKNQYFNADSTLEFNQEYMTNSEQAYSESPAEASDIDLDEAASFSLDVNPSSVPSTKVILSSKQNKKIKKSKDCPDPKACGSDLSDVKSSQDDNSSDDSSQDESSLKSCSEAENSQSEDSSASFSKVTLSHSSSQSLIFGTSLKIAKSGDYLKISKSGLKIKQREGRRATSAGDNVEGTWSKHKVDGKKERKRRRAESADSISERSPVRTFHLNVDSSLMPPPTSSSETLSTVVSTSDSQSVRPLTLNVKASSAVTSSSSPSRSKSPIQPKKSNSSGNSSVCSPSKSGSGSKSSVLEKSGVKPSPPRCGSFPSVKVSSSESNGNPSSTKVTLSTSLKLQSKHKTGSNSKSSSSNSGLLLSHSSGRSSPNKTKPATLKLKNLNLPSSTTITPIVSKPLSSPTSNQSSLPPLSSSISIIPASAPSSPPGKQSSSNSKTNKSALRSRKGSLSAVIDKLRVTASNAQHPLSLTSDNSKGDGNSSRTEGSSERRESKLERKESVKESRDGSSNSKNNESKAKYFSSDQFTVKQSSQGIKLTVTKTRSSEGSSKSSKSKVQSSKTSSVTSSGLPNPTKATSSSNSSLSSKSGSSSPASKKSLMSSSTNLSKSSSLSSGSKSSINPTHKSSSPSATPTSTSPRISSSTTSSSKIVSKLVTSSSSQVKLSTSSSGKALDKADKKPANSVENKSTCSELKGSSSSLSGSANLMPPPTSNKSLIDLGRSSGSGNTPKRADGSPIRHSPRHTPTRDGIVDETEGERAFRLLLAQTKKESQNGAEQMIPSCKASDLVMGTIDPAKTDAILVKLEPDEKGQRVSSSTDVKPSSTPRMPALKTSQELMHVLDQSLPDVCESKPTIQTEVSSSSKHDILSSASIVTSSEETNKIMSSFGKPHKQTMRPNSHSDEDSSPEDGLVIDYPDTPRLQKSPDKKMPWSSPRLESSIQLNASEDKSERGEPSPSSFGIKSPYQPSPLKSPAQVITPPSNHSLSSSLSRPSPCIIDDDLMDEALMTIGK